MTINRKAITLTGVTASDRTYNAAKTAVLAAANPSCAQLDFGTATYSNGVLTIPVTGLNLNGTDDVNNLSYKITVTGVYASGDAGENIAVTLTGTLDTELAKRYTLNALGSANANINKAVLTVTCVQQVSGLRFCRAFIYCKLFGICRNTDNSGSYYCSKSNLQTNTAEHPRLLL